jgi:uncharacterized membrane protein
MRRAFAAAAAGWVFALPLAAFAASRPHATAAADAFALTVYGFGRLVCHQLPERSFHLWGVPLPVCARCTGIYIGAALAAAAGSVALTPMRDAAARWMLTLAALPTMATLLYEWTTGVMPGHWIRALAGFPLGAAVAIVVVSAIATGRGRERASNIN